MLRFDTDGVNLHNSGEMVEALGEAILIAVRDTLLGACMVGLILVVVLLIRFIWREREADRDAKRLENEARTRGWEL